MIQISYGWDVLHGVHPLRGVGRRGARLDPLALPPARASLRPPRRIPLGLLASTPVSDSKDEADPAEGTPRGEVTRLLAEYSTGQDGAEEALLALIYEELRRLARSQLSSEREGHTLEPTALVHEAWLRLNPEHAAGAQSRGHYLALAARIMRRLLVDHARRRIAAKRGGDAKRVTLSEMGSGASGVDVLEAHDALEALAEADPELARIAELHIFAGMTQAEVSAELGIPKRTLERRWRVASTWLRKELAS